MTGHTPDPERTDYALTFLTDAARDTDQNVNQVEHCQAIVATELRHHRTVTAPERDRLKAKLGSMCAYPLCDCGGGKECMVIDMPPPDVCARSDFIELSAKHDRLKEVNADLLEALKRANGLAAAWAGHYSNIHQLSDLHPDHQEILDEIAVAIARAESSHDG